MAKSIKDLRQEKGFRSAREFADALGIATSSMSRYDKDPETIPMKHAWAMADALETAANAYSASGEASGEVDLEQAYKEYLHEWLIAEDEVNDTMTEEIRENEFMPLIYAGDYTSFPAEMLWSGMLETGIPMTYEEFVAAGGIY